MATIDKISYLPYSKTIPMKRLLLLSLSATIATVLFLSGCTKDKVRPFNKAISGAVQKGPFLSGTSVMLYELDKDYSQTGKTFYTQITNNIGSFQIDKVALTSNFVALRADGFYFNEVCGSNSISQLTLNAISDVSNTNSLHVNILTHLEKPRVEYLAKNGMAYDAAKKMAQSEVLNIFNISSTGIQNSEYLDISNNGNGDGILLAVSAILQGYRTESELSSILTTISVDLSSDGILDNTLVKSSLIDHALLLDTVSIRNNITNYYLNLGITPSIHNFEYYIKQFINNSTYTATNTVINYPAMGDFGDNILNKSKLTFSGSTFSVRVLPKKCTRVKINIHSSDITDFTYVFNSLYNWNVSQYDETNKVQSFTVINSEQAADVSIMLKPGKTFLIEYFENDFSKAAFSKTIKVN